MILTLVVARIGSARKTEAQISPSVAGTQERVETYFGRPLFRSLTAMAADLGVTIYPEDRLQTFPNPELGLGSKLTIVRATPVLVNDGSNRYVARTFKKTIGELLEEKRIVLGTLDSIEPGLETPLLWEGTITIMRVEETDIVEKQSIAFRTVTRSDPNVYVCSSQTAQEGKNGTKETTYKVRRENGVEVSRQLISTETTAQPVDKIVLTGSRLPPVYEEGKASWYDWRDGYYAAHKTLPKGSVVYVKSTSNGRGICVTINDRGPFGPGRVIDLQPEAFVVLAPLWAGLTNVTLHVLP